MKNRQQSSTNYPIPFILVSSTDHVSAVTGATATVTISKDGAAFASPSGAVTEIGNGWYKLAGNATDRNTLGSLLLHATATGADPADDRYEIVPYDPFDGVRLGLTSLPNAAAAATGGLPTVDATNAVKTQNVIRKNTAFSNFAFYLTTTDHVTAGTSLTVTAQRSLDGAAFAGCANSVTELSNGVYLINLAAADVNANVVVLRFTATGADARVITILTQP